jgi:multicomponent Na+:H+ antiporter subunit C
MIDMSPNLVLVVVIAALFTVGVYLLLERSLSRVLIGVILLGNGTNLLFLVAGGAAGGPPILGLTEVDEMSDPLPQAMILTAIVITLGMTAFLLAMAYRSWQLHGHDEVQDDVEDRRIARLAAIDERAFLDVDAEETARTLDEDAVDMRDETDAAVARAVSALLTGAVHADRHDEPPSDEGERS